MSETVEKVETPSKWLSAPEVLEQLLPQLQKLGGFTPGRGNGAPWRQVYLGLLEHCPNVTVASRMAGVTREAVRLVRNQDAEFAAAEKQAMATGADLVEASAFKSAVYGDLEPVFHQGVCVGHVVKYSDAMRALLLKGLKPDTYREKIEHTGEVTHRHLTLAELDERLKLARARPGQVVEGELAEGSQGG